MKTGNMKCNGQNLYYEIHGEGDSLVLIIGIGYDATLWGLYTIPAFAKNYQVIAFDNRDSGRSSQASSPYTITDMANDVDQLMEGLKIESAHILGLSMGGMIAQELAIQHPNRVKKLVLTGTEASTARAKFNPISLWNFVKRNDGEGLTFAAQQFIWLFSTEFNRDHKAVNDTLALLGSNPNPVSEEAYERQANAYIQHDSLDRLGNIKAQTLLISGKRDRLTPPWIMQEVADRIPAAQFISIKGPGASHALPLERPDDFNNAVLSFLK